jgi:2-isopropylmalate synthase
VVAGTEGPQTAHLTVTIDGEARRRRRRATGRWTPCSTPSTRSRPHEAVLRLFQVHAVTEGTDAQAQVSVRLEEDGRIATGQAADTDTLTASAKAYVNALNNLWARKEKTRPEPLLASGF